MLFRLKLNVTENREIILEMTKKATTMDWTMTTAFFKLTFRNVLIF